MINNIIFDIGNVMVDFCWADFLAQKGFDQDMIERIANVSVRTDNWNQLDRGVWSYEQVVQSFVDAAPELEKELHQSFDSLVGIVKMRDYACSWVQELKAKGYGVYYLSNYGLKTRQDTAEELLFMQYMDGGIMSYEEKLIKPGHEIYNRLFEKYNLNPEECVFLDDTVRNVEASIACGMPAIVFTTKEAAVDELKKMGVNA